MTIQQAIRDAKTHLAWQVTPNGDVTVTVRYEDTHDARRTTEIELTSQDKEQELIARWLTLHDGLDARIDSVHSVRTPTLQV